MSGVNKRIVYTISFLSQCNTNPMQTHQLAAKRVLRYRKGSINYNLFFRKSNDNFDVDADWTKTDEPYTPFKLQYKPVSWQCKKHITVVTLSPTEGENMALSTAVEEAAYLHV